MVGDITDVKTLWGEGFKFVLPKGLALAKVSIIIGSIYDLKRKIFKPIVVFLLKMRVKIALRNLVASKKCTCCFAFAVLPMAISIIVNAQSKSGGSYCPIFYKGSM